MADLNIEFDEHNLDYCDPDESVTVRISNPAAENGCEQEPGPLTWMNSARITTDPKDDAVHCLVSVGDPRGAFCFTIHRKPDGGMLIHMPHPGEGMPHIETKQLHEGTLQMGQWVRRYPKDQLDIDTHEWRENNTECWHPMDASDPEPEEGE